MGLISSLFSSSKAFNAATRGIDAVVFTDQEKKTLHAQMLPLYEPFKLTQRVIAFAIVLPFVFWHSVCFATDLYHVAYLKSERIMEGMITLNNDVLGIPAAIVLAFYFSGGVIESWKRK